MTENDDIDIEIDYPKSALKMKELFIEGSCVKCCNPMYEFLIEVNNTLLENAYDGTKEIESKEDSLNQRIRGALGYFPFFWICAEIVNGTIIPTLIVEEILRGKSIKENFCFEYSSSPYLKWINNGTQEAWDYIRNYFLIMENNFKTEKTIEQIKLFFPRNVINKDNYTVCKASIEAWEEKVKSFEKSKKDQWEVIRYYTEGDLQVLMLKLSNVKKPLILESLIDNIIKDEIHIRYILRSIKKDWKRYRSSDDLKCADNRLIHHVLGQYTYWPQESLKDNKLLGTASLLRWKVDYRNKVQSEGVDRVITEINKLVKKKQGYGPGNKKQKKYVLTDEHIELIGKASDELNSILKVVCPVKDIREDKKRAENFAANCIMLDKKDLNFNWHFVAENLGKVDLAKRIIQRYLIRVGKISSTPPSLKILGKYLIDNILH